MKGVPLPAAYSPRTVPALLAERATARPDETAVHAKGERGYETRTFAELADDVRRLAAVLTAHGVKPGYRVAWLIDNRRGLDAIRLYHAVLWAGGVNVPINTRLAPREVDEIVRRSAARLVVVAPQAPMPADLTVVPIDELTDRAAHHAAAGEPDPYATDLTTATILFTSGTTGRPKGVVHTHGSSLAAAIGWSEALGLAPGEVLQSPFPVFSGAGLHFNGLSSLWAGAEYVIDDYDTATSLTVVEGRASTVYVAVPSIYAYWLDSPALAPHRLATLRLLDYGGAAMAPALIEALNGRLPGVELMHSYGLTEAGPGGTFLPPAEALTRPGSIGRDCAGAFMRYRVVDDDGHDVPSGEPGELVLRGPAVMDGYLDDPDATAEALGDGWLRSGDIVRTDADGYLYVIDRKKDIIVRGGFNISSAEVEAALLSHPDVLDVAVVGVPHPHLGEDVHAFVVSRAGRVPDPEQLTGFMRGLVGDFKVPRGYSFPDSLPRNASGKVLKPLLRDRVANHTT